MNLDRRQLTLIVGAIALVVLVLVVVLIPRPGNGPGSSAGASPSASPALTSASPPSSPSVTPPSGSSASPSPSTSGSPTPVAPTAPAGSMSGTWTGTWTNVTPDQATGTFEVELVQTGSELSGTITVTGSSCFTSGGVQGTVQGDAVAFQVLQRDEIAFVGTTSGTTMSGTFASSCDSSTGTWELSKGGG